MSITDVPGRRRSHIEDKGRGDVMAYSGFLIKVGDYIIPDNKYIFAKSYNVTRNVQDLDSYRDANGVLHRTALDHAPIKVEFETPPMLTDITFGELMWNISRNYISYSERKVLATVYVPELNGYVTQEMYMTDPKASIYSTKDGRIYFNAIRFAFIGY